MAQILISEHRPDLRRMIQRMLERLGHESLEVDVPAPGQLTDADLVLVNPTGPAGVVLCQAVRIINPSLPLVCVSAAEPPAELAELGIEFAARLTGRFTVEQLSAAIDGALAGRDRPGSSGGATA